jgi:hypothetical protein
MTDLLLILLPSMLRFLKDPKGNPHLLPAALIGLQGTDK